MLEIGVPVYKAKEVLPNLLNSLVAQTKDNFIVCLSIDGDNEDYGEIIRTYTARGLKIRLINSPVNGGPGMARQRVLDTTICDYITFADADDMVTPRFVELLYTEAKAGNYDIIRASFIRENSKGADVMMSSTDNVITWMHGKIYRVAYLKEKDIHFLPELRVDEDAYFNMVAINSTKKVGLIQEPVYIWRDYKNSLTRQGRQSEYFRNSYYCFIFGQVQALIKIYELNGTIVPELVANVLKQVYYHYMTARFYQADEAQLDEALGLLKNKQWMQQWLLEGSNWINIVNTIKAGAVYDNKIVAFYQETFNVWANRLLKGEVHEQL